MAAVDDDADGLRFRRSNDGSNDNATADDCVFGNEFRSSHIDCRGDHHDYSGSDGPCYNHDPLSADYGCSHGASMDDLHPGFGAC
jgi:hypothetical protein